MCNNQIRSREERLRIRRQREERERELRQRERDRRRERELLNRIVQDIAQAEQIYENIIRELVEMRELFNAWAI